MHKAILLPYRTYLASMAFAVLACCLHAQTPLTVTLHPNSPGRTIPSDFEGISFEMFTAVNVGTTSYPTTNAPVNDPSTAWFNSANSPLGTLLQTIGVKNVRVGGTSSEEPTLFDKNAAYPQQYDAAYVSAFVQKYGMELIWGLPAASTYDLKTFSTFATDMAAAQKSNGQTFKMIWEIGNEPDIQEVGATTYDSRFDAYMNSLRSSLGTSVLLLGPSEVNSSTSYINALMADPDYDSSNATYHANIADFSHHLYPLGCANGQSSVDAAIKTMLQDNSTTYDSDYASWASTAVYYGYPTRFDEVNSYCDGGYNGASNAFAAALWGLDILEYYSHNHSVAGLNFHEGVTGNSYAPFTPQSLSSSYTVQGLGYGMLAFSTHGAGQVMPATLSGSGSSLNVTAYGTLRSTGGETAVIINKTSVLQGDNTDVTLTIVPGSSFKYAKLYYLQAPNNDPTQTTGITFAGSSVQPDGTFNISGPVISPDANGNFAVPLSHSEAVVVNMYNNADQ